jgi:rhodanese-related sulfurtransferase
LKLLPSKAGAGKLAGTMKTLFTTVLGLFVLSSAPFAIAGEKEPFALIHTSDLATLLKNESAKLAVYDVNTPEVRKENGVIPHAKLLGSSSKYDTAKELPSDRTTKLVFYCANTQCMASHKAADRAVKAGYKDVAVMADGIQGWKSAGQPTTKVD